MHTERKRVYLLDGDVLEVISDYNDEFSIWIERYMDFESTPRYTPNGRRWRSVTTTDCKYADPVFRDCGTCPYLQKEKENDLIGVCFHESLRCVAETDTPEFIDNNSLTSIGYEKGTKL